MISLIYIVGVLVVLSFAYVCLFGAPFVPTRKLWAQQALGLARLTQRDLVVDLGSGSGTILGLLAAMGVRSVGYELNPLLWAWSRLKFIGSRLVTVKFANFWRQELPAGTTLVYVFALQRDAGKLVKYFKRQNRPLKVITFGFELPREKAIKQTTGAFLYQF